MSSADLTSSELGYVFPASCPCANICAATGKSCGKVGVKACSNCYLVAYCSKECQTRHWKKHKADCKSKLIKTTWRPSWEVEQRYPSYARDLNPGDDAEEIFGEKKFLWGNMPALDILNLEQNEGIDYDKDINLLFAASGDMRNVVKTIISIPSACTSPSITAFLNDGEFDVVARNAILLLTALYVQPPTAAAAAMLHIWYSALIPSSILETLQDTVLSLIIDVCTKIAAKPLDKLLSKTFTRGTCSVRLVLERRHWLALMDYLVVPDGLTAAEAQRLRVKTMLAEVRKDHIERTLCCQTPGWRSGTMRFRTDGLLLPFGASRQAFDTPNPTFYHKDHVWPMMDNADPLSGWDIEDALKNTPLAKNDFYGGLFFHLRGQFTDFCTKLQTRKTTFVLLFNNATDLRTTLARDFNLTHSFDRIEISNIVDDYYLGLDCLPAIAPLLRPHAVNPRATLLALFMNAIPEVETHADAVAAMGREMHRVAGWLPPGKQEHDAKETARWAAYKLLVDFDELFARYVERWGFDRAVADARLRTKEEHTIVEKWPLRVKEHATKAEFERIFGSDHCGSERYVEWQRLP